MKTLNKKIYIINGVMGVIGSPVFTYLAQQPDTIIYGISRKGLGMETFVTNNKLPESHLVFSLGDYLEKGTENIKRLVDVIPDEYEVIFLHSMGGFVTELDEHGKYVTKNDTNGDGINDYVKKLTYEVPLLFASEFSKIKQRVIFTQIGSLSDSKNLQAHYSWVESMNLLKQDLTKICSKNNNFNSAIINVSSVLTPKELIDRPFVTTQTNAEISFWLDPVKIGEFVHNISDKIYEKNSEFSLFKPWPKFENEHFTESRYIQRRVKELFLQK